MSAEAAARGGLGMADRWRLDEDPAKAADGAGTSPGGLMADGSAPSTGPTLVRPRAAAELPAPGVAIAAADGAHSSTRDELLSIAAALIGQAIELHRGLEEVSSGPRAGDDVDASLAGLVADYERRLIEAALQRTRGNQAQAARLLRTTERILGYRVQRYGIDCDLFRD